MQLDGWQRAETEAAPGRIGVTDPEGLTGMVVGVVERNSRLSPVSCTPLVSNTVAVSGWVLF